MEGWDPDSPPILDDLGLPRCADPAVIAAAKGAMENGPSNLYSVQVFDVADVRERGEAGLPGEHVHQRGQAPRVLHGCDGRSKGSAPSIKNDAS